MSAWQNKDFEQYVSYYHPKYSDGYRSNLSSFKAHKKNVFAMPGTPEIKLRDLSIQMVDNYAVIIFTQDYKSNTVNDIGKKILYLQLDEYYNWKIISEIWSKNDLPKQVTGFQPSMRFFASESPEVENINEN
jgi:murein L,D-transpeptidase YafK